MLDVLIKGGPVMIPLVFSSILALAITLERVWYLSKTRTDSEELIEEVRLSLEEGKPLEAIHQLKRQKGPVARILAAGLAFSDRNREDLRSRLAQVGQDEVYKMERRLSVLETIVTVAPLLGLLGTVTGIIASFQVLGTMEGLGNPQELGSGIAEALITTAAGLIIAIPSMAAYNWISSMIDRRVLDMNRRAEELLDLLAAEEGA